MLPRSHIFLMLSLLGIPFFTSAQTARIDSLQQLLKNDADDSNKVEHLCRLSIEFNYIPQYNTAMAMAKEALTLARKLDWKKGEALANNNIGVTYADQGDYDKALSYYLKSLRIRSEVGDKCGMALSYNNIGIIYNDQSNFTMAMDYYGRSLSLLLELEKNGATPQIKQGLAHTYNNMGNAYYNQDDYTNALLYHHRSLDIEKEMGNKQGISASLNNIGVLYSEKGDYKKALDYHFKSLALKEEIKDRQGVAYSYSSIAFDYKKMAELETSPEEKQKKLALAEQLYIKALDIFNDIDFKLGVQEAYDEIADLYAAKKDFEKAYSYYRLSTAIKDSMINRETGKQIAEMQARYEDLEKGQQIILLNKDKELRNSLVNRQQLIIWSAVLGLLLVLGFALFAMRSLGITKRQKRIIEEQKAMVDEKQKAMLDSIHYAKRIQSSLLPTEKYIDRHLQKLKRQQGVSN